MIGGVRGALNYNCSEIKENFNINTCCKTKRSMISSDALKRPNGRKGNARQRSGCTGKCSSRTSEHKQTNSVGQSSHAGNNSAAQPDPHRCFGGVWSVWVCSNSKRCKPHPFGRQPAWPQSSGDRGTNVLHQGPSPSQLP
jgi:hypothetical protein